MFSKNERLKTFSQFCLSLYITYENKFRSLETYKGGTPCKLKLVWFVNMLLRMAIRQHPKFPSSPNTMLILLIVVGGGVREPRNYGFQLLDYFCFPVHFSSKYAIIKLVDCKSLERISYTSFCHQRKWCYEVPKRAGIANLGNNTFIILILNTFWPQ